MLSLKLCVMVLSLCAAVDRVYGHGMLIEPPNRSSMWRYGFNTPPNYSDNEIYCGGYGIQHGVNGGKCGECGDNWANPRPRDNENTGKYGTGVVAKTYKAGQMIKANIKLNANHAGYFEYKLCVLENPKALETDDCFDQHLLRLENGSDRFEVPPFIPGEYEVTLQLPQGLTCDRCVLQWTYHTANTWGACEDGTSAVGCGPQETFRNCADIAIE